MTQLEISTNSSVPSPLGLTPLHIAVLANKYHEVRKIASDREQGIEARTETGTTAYMLAALYGRTEIFLFLTRKKASPYKKDVQGNNALDYVKQESPFIKDLVQEYKSISAGKPDRAGRGLIYGVLKARQRDSKRAYDKGCADAAAEYQAQAQAQPQPSVDMEQDSPQQASENPTMRFAFLRSLSGKQQEFVEVKRIAAAEHFNLGRKCTGFIRDTDENSTHMFAISGWGNAKDKNVVCKNVLDSKEFTELVRRVALLLDFELKANPFDENFPGSPSEKKGIFLACHSEKQLAVYILIKAISHVFGTKSLTCRNITELKNRLDELPPGLRETVIHLDHKLVCRSCLQFLKLLIQKTGLIFRCESQDWYLYGKRTKLRPMPDGSYKKITKDAKRSDASDGTDIIEDEIGIFDTDEIHKTDLQGCTVDHDGDSSMLPGKPVTPSTSNHQSSLMQQRVRREPYYHPKEGSAVEEEPKHDSSKSYNVPPVTPPSMNSHGLPTPQSNTKLAERPRITISPSPAGASSAFGPQAYSMSPSMSPEYEVEDILQFKEENGEHLFLVKWKGYSHDTNSWEPEANLANASETIDKFWEELRAAQSRSQDLDAQKLVHPSSTPGLAATIDN